ncbi:MAG TPA: hypothetical protein VFU05_20580 [Cyclobacteriaceae bacterium]|nr:hypothetical protein [Cyclobacteriaceae bacterium]
MNKVTQQIEPRGLYCAILFLAALTAYSQDDQKIIVGGKPFNRDQIHVYPNIIPEFKIVFPAKEQEVISVETIGTLNNENFIVTTWLQTEADEEGMIYHVVHHKVPPSVENELNGNSKKVKDFLETTVKESLSAFGAIDIKIEEHTYNDYLGLEFSSGSEFSKLLFIKCRIYKIKSDLFFICAVDRKTDINSMDQFLNSFGLK